MDRVKINKEILKVFKIQPQKLDQLMIEKIKNSKVSEKKSIVVDSDKLKIEL